MFFKVVLQERELYGRALQAWKIDLKFKGGSPKKSDLPFSTLPHTLEVSPIKPWAQRFFKSTSVQHLIPRDLRPFGKAEVQIWFAQPFTSQWWLEGKYISAENIFRYFGRRYLCHEKDLKREFQGFTEILPNTHLTHPTDCLSWIQLFTLFNLKWWQKKLHYVQECFSVRLQEAQQKSYSGLLMWMLKAWEHLKNWICIYSHLY